MDGYWMVKLMVHGLFMDGSWIVQWMLKSIVAVFPINELCCFGPDAIVIWSELIS